MNFNDTAVFALAMLLGGLFLLAAVLALGVIAGLFFAAPPGAPCEGTETERPPKTL